MKLLGRELALAPQPAEIRVRPRELATETYAPGAGDVTPGLARGSDYESWDAGWAPQPGGPDTNPELAGRLKYEWYREMRLSDPAVRSLLWLFTLLIRSADAGIEPASEDGSDQLVADFIAAQFGLEDRHGLLDQTWDQSLSQALLCLPYGAQGEEMVWNDLTVWRDDEGTEHQVVPLARLAPRSAASIAEIEHDRRTGKIVRVRQDLPDADWIPGESLAWYVLDKEGSNWWGTSLLRAAFGAWRDKKNLMTAAGIAYDRYSSGVPIVRYPSGTSRANEYKAQRIGRNYRVHQKAWVVLEGTREEGWDFAIADGSRSIVDFVPMLRHYDQQIAMAGLQQFTSLGSTERGSRAVGDVLSDPFYSAVQAIAGLVVEERTRSVFRRIVDVNFGEDVAVPKLRISKIQGRNITVLTRAIADLSAAGFTFTDRDTQDDLRDVLELRHLPDQVAGAVRALPEDVGVTAAGGIPAEGSSILPRPPAGASPVAPPA